MKQEDFYICTVTFESCIKNDTKKKEHIIILKKMLLYQEYG